jgi:formylglycine-generating enzyme required for sulfatase activity
MLTPDIILKDRYCIIGPAGRGGMGAVYKALDRGANRLVAVKESYPKTDELCRAFRREAELLGNLQHPALPFVIEHFQQGEGQFLIMQFIPGDNLRELLCQRGRPFEVERVLEWADQLLDALEEMHGNRPPIIHRDIKPANLKLTAKGRVMLLDFGLAKGVAGEMSGIEDGESLSSVHGFTPHYAPLEQIRDGGTDPRSDIYSLGATLWTLLTNQVPADVLTRITEQGEGRPDPLRPAHELNPEVPPSLSAVLSGALSIYRQTRTQTTTEMRRALHEIAVMLRRAEEARRLEGERRRAEEQRLEEERRSEEARLLEVERERCEAEALKLAEAAERAREAEERRLRERAAAMVEAEEAARREAAESEAAARRLVEASDVMPEAGDAGRAPDKLERHDVAALSDLPSTLTSLTLSSETVPSKEDAAASPAKPPREAQAPEVQARRAPQPEASIPQIRWYRRRLATLAALAIIMLAAAVILLGPSRGGGAGASADVAGVPAVRPQTQPTAAPPPAPTPSPVSAGPEPPPGMAYVPGGTFWMGRDKEDGGDEYERPAHQVSVEPFFIDINEVTNEEYAEFVAAKNWSPPSTWDGKKQYPEGAAHKPVTGVTWNDAVAYAHWAGKRLPTEEEWEFVARGDKASMRYPWGNDWVEGAANVGGVSGGVADVGSYPRGRSPLGLNDLIGNAWEWTATPLKAYPNGKLKDTLSGDEKVIRGRSFGIFKGEDKNKIKDTATATYRGYLKANSTNNKATGFRCARDIAAARGS